MLIDESRVPSANDRLIDFLEKIHFVDRDSSESDPRPRQKRCLFLGKRPKSEPLQSNLLQLSPSQVRKFLSKQTGIKRRRSDACYDPDNNSA